MMAVEMIVDHWKPEPEEVPHGDLLLRTTLLPFPQARTHTKSTGPSRYDLGGRGLDRRGRLLLTETRTSDQDPGIAPLSCRPTEGNWLRRSCLSPYALVMDYDTEKVDQAVLALLYLTLRDVRDLGSRAWKGYDWDAMNRLHEKGYIGDPVSKAKSVTATDKGLKESQRLFDELFGAERA